MFRIKNVFGEDITLDNGATTISLKAGASILVERVTPTMDLLAKRTRTRKRAALVISPVELVNKPIICSPREELLQEDPAVDPLDDNDDDVPVLREWLKRKTKAELIELAREYAFNIDTDGMTKVDLMDALSEYSDILDSVITV